ncbi:MAG: polysaccharide deacetylase family protein [Brevinematales bacterium]|nr:polysaccharide deacetylase family protein [Brevinematales bacterium]
MKKHSFLKKNFSFILLILLFTLVLISQYIMFEDYFDEKISKIIAKYDKTEKLEIDEKKSFFNQFRLNKIEEIYENLSGKIPILEYHIIETPSVYSNYILTKKIKKTKDNERFFVSSEDFKKHLEILYKKGYRNISLDEYLSIMKGQTKDFRRITPGSKLFVLTFDDATFGQFDFITNEKGEIFIDSDCAVGIMIDFAKKHPEFKLNAAFSIDFENIPFHQKEYVTKKLNLLLDYGFEIVNHSYSHKSLSKLYKKNPERVSEEIGRAMEIFESHLGYRVSHINKICYPNGDNSEDLQEFIKKINYKGKEYDFIAAIDAEGPLAINPNDTNFDPYAIRRIEINNQTFNKYVINAKGVYTMPPLVLKTPETEKLVKTTTNLSLELIKLP